MPKDKKRFLRKPAGFNLADERVDNFTVRSFDTNDSNSNASPRKRMPGHRPGSPTKAPRSSVAKANNIAQSAGTSRLNRILDQSKEERIGYVAEYEDEYHAANLLQYKPQRASQQQQDVACRDPLSEREVAAFVGKVVVPPLKVDERSIGGHRAVELHTLSQEALMAMRCRQFELVGDATLTISQTALAFPDQYAKHKRSLGFAGGPKARNKIKYVCLVRSTNRPLSGASNPLGNKRSSVSSTLSKSDDEVADYDKMYQGDEDEGEEGANRDEESKDLTKLEEEADGEVSSFPVLVCLTINPDGTSPDVRKLIELDQLATVQNVSTGGAIQLVFADGDMVKIDFAVEEADSTMRKERFVWSLLQIHAMLCTSVVERNSLGSYRQQQQATQATTGATKDRLLQPLNVRNLDRGELQYVATVNGFLRDAPNLCALLDRQRDIGTIVHHMDEEERKEEMDGMAYDMMMGNFKTTVALYHSAEERADAEEVLNAISNIQEEESAIAQVLADKLQSRMRDLEAETCRRLIAWEDEKHYSLMGHDFDSTDRESEDALSLAGLFKTLDSLDKELEDMETWLHDRASVIKPLTDDCRDIEEENRQLEQQWKSYEMLGDELKRLLTGVSIDKDSEVVLKNPASALVYDASGNIDIDQSDAGVDKIHLSGKSLKDAMENAKRAGGVHLRAVNERVEDLTIMSNSFCTALAQIIVTVMEQIKSEVMVASDNGKVSKSDTHGMIAKKVRETQRKFQSALLGYMKLIEVLSLLRPTLLQAIRDAYSEMVAEGILMKKRMKGYFQALPGKNSAYLNLTSKDLKDYSGVRDADHEEKKVNAADIRAALAELLPVIAREAYFTAALFGLSAKQLDGREKKRNFESAKKSVDHSTQYFRYYIQRTCGIVQDMEDPVGSRSIKGDPMLSLVASIHLNEAMDQYIDREKKGGDHSLSLAYVRATILGLRKKVDKQWVEWVEEQIEWIKSNPGVPASGKRAGIFMSFSRFPVYLDHILKCCREGRATNYTPDLANIQVVSYYLQKIAGALLESLRVCSERESTDQQYAANVMRMENTYFFSQQLKERGPEISSLFQKQLTKASAVCKQSTDAYLGWMIKREFKALHALFSQISRIRRDVGDKDVPIHIPRATFVKTLQKESNREVMKEKIATIYARMEKHLSEEGGLLPVAWKALVKVMYEWFGRWEKLSSQCYKHVLEPSAVDVVRLAKQAGGGASGAKSKVSASLVSETAAQPSSSRTRSTDNGGKPPSVSRRQHSSSARRSVGNF
uniref:Exocyst complex component Sec3 C-terminal domain-containing protein n=1 Tax=Grammatophora oceanica TaxID=210454 RepID=A0A7S1V7N1_9STRA|mmetsp:Transcript_38855/g.57780  ORF Transcript_38855/g.57780 Transcript_38855/m.57780 type:complete len:1268 (+) Transcript_38855:84-3887(+)